MLPPAATTHLTTGRAVRHTYAARAAPHAMLYWQRTRTAHRRFFQRRLVLIRDAAACCCAPHGPPPDMWLPLPRTVPPHGAAAMLRHCALCPLAVSYPRCSARTFCASCSTMRLRWMLPRTSTLLCVTWRNTLATTHAPSRTACDGSSAPRLTNDSTCLYLTTMRAVLTLPTAPLQVSTIPCSYRTCWT